MFVFTYFLCVLFLHISTGACISININDLRVNASSYENIEFRCEVSDALYAYMESDALMEAARSQAMYLSDPECPFSHDTCHKYCAEYSSCDWVARIRYYSPLSMRIGEVISEVDDLKFIVEHDSVHCGLVMSRSFTHYGYASSNNYTTYVFSFEK